MPDLPPLGKIYIAAFADDSLAHPVVEVVKDNRASGYEVPADGSPCPDPRFPDHRFNSVIPTTVDARVIWRYLKLPSATLTGQEIDPSTGIIQTWSQHDTVANSEDGTPLSNITPLDSSIDQIRTTVIPNSALSSFSISFPDYINIPLPEVLTGVAVVWEKSGNDGNYSETGSGTATGDSINLSMSASGSGQGSAGVIAELIPTYAPARGLNVPVLNLFFYLQQPSTHAALLAKLLTLDCITVSASSIVAGVVTATAHGLSVGEQFQFRTLTGASGANLAVNTTYFVKTATTNSFTYALSLGGSAVTTGAATAATFIPVIQPWPNFRPIEDTLILKGQKISGQLNVKAHSAMSVNSSGDNSNAETTGLGASGDYSPSIRAVVLKPSIHALITLSGGTSNSVTKDIEATAEITGSGGLPSSGDTITGTVYAEGSVTPTTLAATPVESIPTFGRYLMKPESDLSKYAGWSVFRATIVDFSQV